jgi:glycosyltransferase involved in cell wall biosynthesis
LSVPDVSVVVPTRDRCQKLSLALRSALGQHHVDLEVVVVDDGSTDATERVVSDLRDARIRFVRLAEPGGVSNARNAGVAMARGRWIGFLDDDDVWAPTKLARQLDVMESSGRVWSYAGDVMVDVDLNILAGAPPPSPDEVMRSLERHNSVPAGASNVIVHRDALSTVGPFDPSLTNGEDWDMWIRLGRLGPPEGVCRPLVAISYHDGNASHDMAAMLQQLDVVAARYGIRVDRARHFRWAAWRALVEGHRGHAAARYARAAAAGDVSSLARATVALVAPTYAIRRARPPDAIPGRNAWIAEARTWLDALVKDGTA